ncbi:hypothetical protein ACFLTD_03760 [Elusimicrobiota bacterium]
MRRRQILVDKKLQIKIIIAAILAISGVFLISGILTYTMAIQLERNANKDFPGVSVESTDDVVLVERIVVKSGVARFILTFMVVILVFATIFTLFYTNRLAGPIYHLQQHIEKMIEGDFTEELQFREKDEFKYLADAINKLQDKLRSQSLS